MVVLRDFLRRGATIRHFENRVPAVGGSFIRTEYAKIIGVVLYDIANEFSLHARCLSINSARLPDLYDVIRKLRHTQIAKQNTAVRVWICAHATLSFGGKLGQFRAQFSSFVEQLFGPVTLHPALEDFDVLPLIHVAHRHLMRAKRPFHYFAINDSGAGPAFGRTQHDHGPLRTPLETRGSRALLDRLNFSEDLVQSGGKQLVHLRWVFAFDEVRRVPAPNKQRLKFWLWNSRQHRRPGDLVAIQMQDRQHGSVAHGVEKLV